MAKRYKKLPGPKELKEIIKEQLRSIENLQGGAHIAAMRIAEQSMADLNHELNAMAIQGGFSWAVRQAALAQVRLTINQLSLNQRGLTLTASRQAISRGVRYVVQQLQFLDAMYAGSPQVLNIQSIAWASANEGNILRSRLRLHVGSFMRYGARTVQAIEQEVVKNVMLGLPWQAARQKVWQLTRDVVENRQWMVDRILRTETAHAHNASILAALQTEQDSGRQVRKQLVATFDNRTGRDSVLLHGQTRDLAEPFYDAWNGIEYMHPPNRPNDREVIVPVYG